MATRKSRDSDCNSVSFLKYVLHIFNVVFLLSGIGVLGVGIWTVAEKQHYVALLTNATYELAAWVLIVTGCLVFVVTVIGCLGVLRNNRFFILVYTFALLLIFLLEAMVGIMSFLYEPHVEEELRLNLNNTFVENYKLDDKKTSAIDQMQIEYKCCGANLFEDWQYSYWQKENLSEGLKVPNSCCKTITPHCGKSDHPSNIHYTGCRHRLAGEIRDHLIILSAVGLGICVLQIFGMIFSCCLYIKLKDMSD
ncbi:CD151 antigen-like [Zootermopsis nevadensis]|uniref:Tetraspanin n=1 Tax=Zootermopsis nevadensis TaxID=136037 RepID=A0A067RIN8_ZOONE|nr:CD151 antigen-like [Zootermopsis nevadensis]XP_021928630.1 CD151 antigen-like [Zootermopsis nevadensis]KDR23711.1 Tetraspanin-11 [Zootermopsis nevadensis]